VRMPLFVLTAALMLAATSSAEEESWKPHATAVKMKVTALDNDRFGRQQIRTPDGKTWVLIQGDGIPREKLAAENVFVPEIDLWGLGLQFVRYFPDGWREAKPRNITSLYLLIVVR
jgi:hypothetical protein